MCVCVCVCVCVFTYLVCRLYVVLYPSDDDTERPERTNNSLHHSVFQRLPFKGYLSFKLATITLLHSPLVHYFKKLQLYELKNFSDNT